MAYIARVQGKLKEQMAHADMDILSNPAIADDVRQNSTKAFNIEQPTNAQRQFLLHIVAGPNLLLKDRTGSGKTFGMAVALASLKVALYVVPNQELASQVQGWLGRLSSRTMSLSAHQAGCCNNTKHILPMFKRIIIDEVDQALKLPKRYAPLRDQHRRERHPKPTQVLIESLLKRASAKPQIIVSSATLNRPLRLWLAHQGWVNDPAIVSLVATDTQPNVTHHCLLISDDTIRNIAPKQDTDDPEVEKDPAKTEASIDFDATDDRMVEKMAILQDIEDVRRGIVFIDPSISVATMQTRLANYGVVVRDIAEYVPGEPWDGQAQLWISTEFSARSMDIPNISHVFLLGRPVSVASYLHMAGRTGRLGSQGSLHPGKVICVMRDKGRAESRMHVLYNFLNISPEPYEHVQ